MRLLSAILVFVALAVTACPTPKKAGCSVAGDCKAGEVCLNGVCKSPDLARCGTETVCVADADCASQSCVEGCCLHACASQSDCPAPLECDNGACHEPMRIGCASDADCAMSTTAPHCDTANSFCVPCVSDDQCPMNGTCENHACKIPEKVGCDVDADCLTPELPRCLVGMHLCVSCLEDVDCNRDGGTMVCNKTTNACEVPRTGCATDSDCAGMPGKEHCRVGDAVCVECTIPEQCHNYPADTCYSLNTCGPVGGCGSDLDCPTAAKPVCDTDRKACAECISNDACSSGFGCGPSDTCIPATGCTQNSQCHAPTPICHTRSGACVQCLTDANCGTDGTCTDGVCHWPPPTLCHLDSDCPRNQVCAAAIYPHDDTQANNICIPRHGSLGPGQNCSDSSQCQSNLCLDIGFTGYCQGACTADSQCPAGPNGMPGACVTINLYWHDSTNTQHFTQVPSCVIQCEGELDCYPNASCLLAPNVTNDNWATRCDPNPRPFTEWGGTECSTQSDCGTGMCIRPTDTSNRQSTKGICAGMCGGSQGVGNCAPTVATLSSAVPTCPASGVKLKLPNSSMNISKPANVCWGPTCTSDSDCPSILFEQWKCRTFALGSGTGKFCVPP